MFRHKASVAEILALHNASMIGRIEARNWLAEEFKGFKNSRREDVDKELEKLGEDLQNLPDVNDDEGI